MSDTITLPKNVLDALKAKNPSFIATATATLNDSNTLKVDETVDVKVSFGQEYKQYTKDDVTQFVVDSTDNELKYNGVKVPEKLEVTVPQSIVIEKETKGGASVHCEKCARKTRSRRHKRAGRRHRKSSKKV